MELRHRRRAFVNRASGLDHTASIANSNDPSDTSEGFCCIWTFASGDIRRIRILPFFYPLSSGGGVFPYALILCLAGVGNWSALLYAFSKVRATRWIWCFAIEG